ncbi:epoxyqueuosine reductase [Breznakiella homolactica]|uniref:Epoxyqueuosine reductase n=1 Tax=Breznakiella homolactica TaxID=2798577 RepID=A0A7T7XQV6_9SPIR|nr:4Fe-4S double cluster binding domain-containing protein [Breznakiella homolactica]QQO10762.1 hypothetical protein JFL75_07555 [Breznakiella homolactica]
MRKSSIDKRLLKDNIRAAVSAAGLLPPRILAPFEPETIRRGSVFSGEIPEQYRKGAPSLLVTALPYGNTRENGGVTAEFPAGTAPGTIAPFAQRNYYREAVRRLQGISRELRRLYGGKKSDYRILCNSPVPEKPLAAACGFGALGRNGLIITPEAGSLVIIAAMTLPFELEGDAPPADTAEFSPCTGCDSAAPPCKAACPTGALRGDGSINLIRCIQWYASGKEDSVPGDIAALWGNRLYGCTECQDACVRNRRPIRGADTAEGPLPPAMDTGELLSLSDEALKARFKGTAMGLSWLGPGAIRRSAQLVFKGTRPADSAGGSGKPDR